LSKTTEVASGSGLLARLARFSPLADPEREVFDWAAVIQAAVQSSPPPLGVEIRYEGPPSEAWVRAQSGGLRVVVDNLLENAYNAAVLVPQPRGKKHLVTVRLQTQRLSDEVKVQNPDQADEAYWCLTVADTGIGLAPETAGQVFDPYFTTKPGTSGLGLGLPLVYSLTEGLGGFVDLSWVPENGTQVNVWLPAARDATREPSPAYRGAVLLCDDEPMMRHVAGKILRHQGFEVLEAGDGVAAVELFLLERRRIRLVILDMVLPGLSGLEVFKEIHEAAPGLPILLSSGFGRGSEVDEAFGLGVAGFLQKPYRAEALNEAVQNALTASTSG